MSHLSLRERHRDTYMRRLKFTNTQYKQGIYVDGHERDDVKEYRKKYLDRIKFLESTHMPPPLCSDNIPSWHAGNPAARRHIVFIYHDESIFHVYDAHTRRWVDPSGSGAIRPKGKG